MSKETALSNLRILEELGWEADPEIGGAFVKGKASISGVDLTNSPAYFRALLIQLDERMNKPNLEII